ncbi:hypothetical protein HYU95_00585 [Candidatus Daviesbacteria bacterium]|nr:hypothetical protein [Candidatus Daviesbacteria bacterium]
MFFFNLDWSKISGFVFTALSIFVFVYSFIKYQEVKGIEKEIYNLESEFDLIPDKIKNPYMNNDQLQKKIVRERDPIKRKINLLKQKRQFILDKIPLIGLFKK